MSNSSFVQPGMPAECGIAFKEWAVICAALESGQQSIILRKGGIHEGRDGFRVAHRAFWLYPTNFHQAADGLSEAAAPFLAQVANETPSVPGKLRFRSFALVDEVQELRNESDAIALHGRHLWSAATVRQRFHYKQPGLFLLVVRIFRQDAAIEVDEAPHFAGCKSWVELPSPLSTEKLQPVTVAR